MRSAPARRISALTLFFATLAGCGGGGSAPAAAPAPVPAPPPTSGPPYGVYDPRGYIPQQGSPAAGAALAAYLAPTDFFNSARSRNDVGASSAGSRGQFTPITATSTTDPFENVVGAGITVQQSGRGNTRTISPTNYSVFQDAVNAASPGDTILLAGGTYNWTGNAYLTVTGSGGNWIVVEAAPGATVTIIGPGLGNLSGTSIDGTDGITFGTATFVDLEGITLTNFRTGISIIGGDHIRIHRNSISNMGNGGIAGARVNNLPTYYEISNNKVSYTGQLWNGQPAQGGWPAAIGATGQYVSVFGNTVSFSNGEGIDPSGENIWIHDNTAFNTVSPAIYNDGSSKVLIENNFVYQDQANNATFWANAHTQNQGRDGIRLADESFVIGNTGLNFPILTDITVRNNIVWGATNQFSYLNYPNGSALNHVRIVNNTFVGGQVGTNSIAQIGAASIGTHSDVIFANNICAWVAGTGSNSIDSTAGLTYSNQLWYNVVAGSLSGPGDVLGTPLFGP